MQAPPRVATIGVRFRPGGLTALFGASIAGTGDREVPLAELPAPLAALVAAIRRARGPASALRAAEALAAGACGGGAGRPRAGAGVVPTRCARSIRRGGGASASTRCRRRWGCRRRRLERLFRRETALAPKQYVRIVRLNAVLLGRLDGAGSAIALIDVALDAGYFDQAHMARDFKALTERRATVGAATTASWPRTSRAPIA